MSPNEAGYYIFLVFILLALPRLKSRYAQIVFLLTASYFIYALSNNYLVFSLVIRLKPCTRTHK